MHPRQIVKQTRIPLLVVVFAALAACASAPELVPLDEFGSGWETRRDALLEVEDWELAGRVAIQLQEEAWSANLDWQQRGENYLLEIYGPLGQGRLQLDGGAAGVTARSGDGGEASAATPEALIYQELGWTLPVGGLRYWIRGVPAPELPVDAVSLDELGRLGHLQQAGWRIDYPRYGESEGIDMPSRMQLDNGEIFVRVVIDTWQISPETRALPPPSGG